MYECFFVLMKYGITGITEKSEIIDLNFKENIRVVFLRLGRRQLRPCTINIIGEKN
jgi:hypothetical protein